MSNAAARKFDVSTGRVASGYYQLQKLRSVHKRIRDMVFLGMKDVDIAKKVGVTPQMVRYTRESPLVKQQLGIMDGAAQANALEIAQQIQEIAPFALRKLEILMLHPATDSRLSAKIASDMLDRAGHTAVKRVAVQHAPMSNSEAIAEIKERARNAGVVSDATIIDNDDQTS